jgi:acetate kinase
MNILIINSGSSSIKFQIFETNQDLIDQHKDKVKLKGIIERIGSEAIIKVSRGSESPISDTLPIKNHSEAIELILKKISLGEWKVDDLHSLADIHAVGHRVAHGGEKFTHSTLIDDDVLKDIEKCIELAPLHNPHNLKGIKSCLSIFGSRVPQVAVFDTAFHSTIPEVNYLYAIPYQLYRRHHIRKYGFHGTSHKYIKYRYRILNKLDSCQVQAISIHLGNGASACAIKNGDSFNTSMGFTPLSGLVMGTRSGDLDPSIIPYIAHKEGLSLDEIDTTLNKSSGLLGVSGLTHDMRDLLLEVKDHQDRRANLAIDIYCARVKHYIGAYLAQMNGADVLIFTGGIGENSAEIRLKICENLNFLGIEIDEALNSQAVGGKEMPIHKSASKVKIWVIPTNEELLIARDTYRCVHKITQ